jgi:hypothetical protein
MLSTSPYATAWVPVKMRPWARESTADLLIFLPEATKVMKRS